MIRTAQDYISALGLEPHIEGGFYRQTFADLPDANGRPISTLIYYMLTDNEAGTWHRVDAAEVWHHYAGAPMILRISLDGRTVTEYRLGSNLGAGERPHCVVPPGAWQQAQVDGAYALCGCTVAPGFQFSKFEQGEPGWSPG